MMAKVMLDEKEKQAIEQVINGALSALYVQDHCGVDSVSTKIEIHVLEEIKKRVHELGSKTNL